MSAAGGLYITCEDWQAMLGKDNIRTILHDVLRHHKVCYHREAEYVSALDAVITKDDEHTLWQGNVQMLMEEICERTEAKFVHHALPPMEGRQRASQEKMQQTVLAILRDINEKSIAHIFFTKTMQLL